MDYIPSSSAYNWRRLLPIVGCLILAALATLADSGTALLDVVWFIFGGTCFVTVISGMREFRKRPQIGSLVLFGGALVWFVTDYIVNWSFLADPEVRPFMLGPWVVDKASLAKTTLLHFVFVTSAAWILTRRRAAVRLSEPLESLIPEFSRQRHLFVLIITLWIVGLLPFFLFTRESGYQAIWSEMVSLRTGGPDWTVQRGGNLHYTWGGYVGQWIAIGQFASLLGGFYAVVYARKVSEKAISWFVWLSGVALAFGSGTRGQMLFIGMPVLGALWLRGKRAGSGLEREDVRPGMTRWRTYLLASVGVLALYAVVQFQGEHRFQDLRQLELQDAPVSSLIPTGNEAFSSSLYVVGSIPERQHFLYSDSLIEGAVRAIPQTILDFFVGLVPRVLWPKKTVYSSQLVIWLSLDVTGRSDFTEGTNLTPGLIGNWYGLYGIFGVLEGGLFFGWLLCLMDGLVSRTRKPMALLFGLAFDTFLFRAFRGLFWQDLYPVLIGIGVLWLFKILSSAHKRRVRAG